MNVHTLLTAAAADVDTTVHPDTVQADLLRGRRALGRRRARRTGAAGLVVAAAVAGALALGGAPSGTQPLAGGGDSALDVGAVQLVDYTGEQPAGFTVDAVPEGWTLLGSDEYALTIGPAGVPDADPGSYTGKLTVLLMSADATIPTDGTPVQVGSAGGVVIANGGGVPGTDNGYGADPDELILYVVDPASGQPVTVQVPGELHWSAEQAAGFAAGVHVTDAAVQGVG